MKDIPKEIVVDNIVYRLVTIRNRSKYVSVEGDILNPYRKQQATLHYNADGYPCCGGGVPIHLYVAHGWVEGWFEGAEVNHKDFNRNNYSASNLEWVSHRDNLLYSLQNNYDTICKSKQGIHNGRATFTEEEVKQIRALYQQGKTIVEIIKMFYPELKTAKQYHSIHSTFSNIVKYKTWKNI